jgi:RNA polymerase sigma-70 factor (ECF subfamily)
MQNPNVDEAWSVGNITNYDLFAQPILTYLGQHMANARDAEDLLLEVFVAAFNDITFSQLPPERQLAWLQRVASNKVIERYRRDTSGTILSTEQLMERENQELSPEQRAARQEHYEHLHQALAMLPAQHQQMLRLRYGHNLSLSEIASILRKSEGSIRKLLSHTLQRLHTLYNQPEKENRQ